MVAFSTGLTRSIRSLTRPRRVLVDFSQVTRASVALSQVSPVQFATAMLGRRLCEIERRDYAQLRRSRAETLLRAAPRRVWAIVGLSTDETNEQTLLQIDRAQESM